jgi:hypothetical protein
MKLTVPVAVDGTTVPVNVKRFPATAGFNDEVSVTEEETCPNAISDTAMHPRTTTRKRDLARITVLSAWFYESVDDVGCKCMK